MQLNNSFRGKSDVSLRLMKKSRLGEESDISSQYFSEMSHGSFYATQSPFFHEDLASPTSTPSAPPAPTTPPLKKRKKSETSGSWFGLFSGTRKSESSCCSEEEVKKELEELKRKIEFLEKKIDLLSEQLKSLSAKEESMPQED
jgi:hypothetical protein